jgi:hypothetical protein
VGSVRSAQPLLQQDRRVQRDLADLEVRFDDAANVLAGRGLRKHVLPTELAERGKKVGATDVRAGRDIAEGAPLVARLLAVHEDPLCGSQPAPRVEVPDTGGRSAEQSRPRVSAGSPAGTCCHWPPTLRNSLLIRSSPCVTWRVSEFTTHFETNR